jgi:FkbM family methyltransferase
MISLVNILDFIGYRCLNFSYNISKRNRWPEEEQNRFFQEDPFDVKRITYPLNSESLVLDIGGYDGVWAMPVFCRYQPEICIYEPHPKLAEQCRQIFLGNSKVTVVEAGLSDHNGTAKFYGDSPEGSVYKNESRKIIEITLRKASDELKKRFKGRRINLMSINIEGSEYDVLPDLIENYDMTSIDYLIIQFHAIVPDYQKKCAEIRKGLEKTHHLEWKYDMIWESWGRSQ